MRPLAITAVVLFVAGCGSSPTTTSGNSGGSAADAPYKFAACMRDHGVSGFPDPQVTTTPGGGVAVRQMVPASTANSPTFKAAQKACRGILPAPGRGGPGHHGPSKQVFLAFAKCLRNHGISGFPDPDAQGQLTLQMISAAGVDLKAPSFLTAARACVSVTHGAITLAAVAHAINGPH
jgi:hypothetical protein